MRNLKKVLSVLLVVAMLAVSMVPAFAAESFTYETQANALHAIGLFNGVSPDSFNPDLGSNVTREQGIAIVVRLLGKADAAAKLSATDADAALTAFTDAKDIDASLKNAVAYAVKNGLVKGASETTIEPKAAMTGNQLATILLRNLGYTVDAAASETAAVTLVEKGGLTTAEATKFATKDLIRDDLVGIAYGSLQAKDSTGVKVIDKLIADKVVDQAAAEKAGIIEKVTSATSMTAKVTGRDAITVTFNGTVDTTKAAITVKRGTTAISTTTKFADDKKSATVKAGSKFSEGDYTITATGVAEKDITATVSFEDEKIAKISFSSDKAVIVPKDGVDEDRWIYIYFKLENQYGEDVTNSYNTYSGDITWNTIVDDEDINFDFAKNGKLLVPIEESIDDNSDEFTYGESVPVSVVYNDNEGNVVTASTILTVASKAGVGSIEVTDLYTDTGKELSVNSEFSTFYLLFDLKDQYGNPLTIDSDEELIEDDLTVSSSNNSVVSFERKTDGKDKFYDFQNLVIDGKDHIALPLYKDDPDDQRAGSAVVTVVSSSTGKMAQYTVKVADGSYAASFTMSKPDVVVLGEKTIIPFTAYDADGKEVTDVDDLSVDYGCPEDYDVELSGADDDVFYWDKNPSTNKAQLVFDPSKDPDLEDGDTVTLTAQTGKTYKTSSITFKLKAQKVPESITGISSSYYKKIAQGSFAEFKYDKLTVEDNYDRVISGGEMKYQLLSDLAVNDAGDTTQTAGQYRMQLSSSSDNIKVIGGYVSGNNTYIGYNTADNKFYEKVYFYGSKIGSATIKVQMQVNKNYDPEDATKVAEWANIPDADYEFTMNAIDRRDVKSFAVGSVADTYDYYYYGADDGTAYGAIDNDATDDNRYGLKKGRSFTNAVSVDGVLADGSKVWVSQQILPSTTSGLVDGYVVSSGLANKVKSTNPDSNITVTTYVYKPDIKDKFEFTAKLNDDVDETVTVPFSVVPSKTWFENVDTVSSSFKVNSADPILSSIALAYNGFAQLSTDGSSVDVSLIDYETLYSWANKWALANNAKGADESDKEYADRIAQITNTKVINKIVADAVVVKDQYGKEHDGEHLAENADIYNIQPDGTILTGSGSKVKVTVITNNGAQTKTFTITIK